MLIKKSQNRPQALCYMQILLYCDCPRTRHQLWPWNSKPALCNIVTHRLGCHQQAWLSSLKGAEELITIMWTDRVSWVSLQVLFVVRAWAFVNVAFLCACQVPTTTERHMLHSNRAWTLNSHRDTCWTQMGHEHFTQRHVLDSSRAWTLYRKMHAGLKQGMNTSHRDTCWTQMGH